MTATHIIAEWVGLITLTFCLGTIGCHLWVLPQNHPSSKWRLFGICMAGLFASTIADLLMRSADMSGRPFDEVCLALPTVLSKTHYGHVWLVRIAALMSLVITFVAGRRHRNSQKYSIIMLLFALILSMTQSASGHASDTGDFSIPEVMDWLHLIAASAWGGGLFALSIVILPGLITAHSYDKELVADGAQRFSKMAGIFVGIIVITSTYNGWHFVNSAEAMWRTPYGRIAGVKAVLLFFLLLLGAFNRYINVPFLQQWAGRPVLSEKLISSFSLRIFSSFRQPQDGRVVAIRFMKSVRIEAVLIACVLLCAAFLKHEIPARHAIHLEHGAGTTPQPMHENGMMHHH
ncbi:MAG: CopD family protein [Nitrospirae bacterium]|nr:CopD family protein [Nitrospirota bacterium]